MKKQYAWFILAGVLSATVFRDGVSGYFLGALYGIIIGIPLYIILAAIIEIPLRHKKNRSEIVAKSITIGTIFLIYWLIYHPPASLLFKRHLFDPIPESVDNLRGTATIDGPTDCSYYLKFNISRDDLDKIVKKKKFIPAVISIEESRGSLRHRLKPSNGSESFSTSIYISWFTVDHHENIEAYVMENHDDYFYEYVIYEPNSGEAIYRYWN